MSSPERHHSWTFFRSLHMKRTVAAGSVLVLSAIIFLVGPSFFRGGAEAVETVPQTPPARYGSLPVVSRDGKRIAFISNRNGPDDLYVISPEGSNEQQVTNSPDAEANVAWSRDRKILFAVFKDDFSHLYEIDADGTHQHELAKV